jgi:hypothetical protein
MRSRILAVAGLSIAALAAATTLASGANAAHGSATLGHGGTMQSHVAAAKSCYSHTGTFTDGLVSNVMSDQATLTATGAADFKLKKACTVKTVVAYGAYLATPATQSEVVTFYKAKKGEPGKTISTQTVKGKDASGVFTIKLKKAVKLGAGSYFVGVQANTNSAAPWYWVYDATASGGVDQWENPGGGYGVCPTWGPVTTCSGANDGTDFEVTLSTK